MSEAIAAVVFDLDGVLVDSESVWDAARREVVARNGGRWQADATRAMMGMSPPQWSRYLHDQLGVPLERLLSTTDFVVFIVSPHSVENEFTRRELQLALQRGVSGEHGAIILPVILADADVPPLLRQFPWIDLRDGNVEKAVGQLVKAIREGKTG